VPRAIVNVAAAAEPALDLRGFSNAHLRQLAIIRTERLAAAAHNAEDSELMDALPQRSPMYGEDKEDLIIANSKTEAERAKIQQYKILAFGAVCAFLGPETMEGLRANFHLQMVEANKAKDALLVMGALELYWHQFHQDYCSQEISFFMANPVFSSALSGNYSAQWNQVHQANGGGDDEETLAISATILLGTMGKKEGVVLQKLRQRFRDSHGMEGNGYLNCLKPNPAVLFRLRTEEAQSMDFSPRQGRAWHFTPISRPAVAAVTRSAHFQSILDTGMATAKCRPKPRRRAPRTRCRAPGHAICAAWRVTSSRSAPDWLWHSGPRRPPCPAPS